MLTESKLIDSLLDLKIASKITIYLLIINSKLFKKQLEFDDSLEDYKILSHIIRNP